MSARPFFLRGYTQGDFGPTEGRTLPAVAAPAVPFAPLTTSEGGARLDTHRVLPAADWLSDDELGQLRDANAEDELLFPRWRGQTAEERAKRAAMRERLRQVRAEFQTTWRQWLLWGAIAGGAIVASIFWPQSWASYGYGWHIATAEEVAQ